MAITAVTPASGTSISAGDSFSFTVDDTYTSMVIKVQTATSLAKAYDSALGGAQSGYTVAVVDNGDGTHTFTTTRTGGWDVSPQLLYVTEDETGTSATTNISYTISSTDVYPRSTEPYSGAFASVDHGSQAGLSDDDHPQYLLADGSRALTGNLTVSGGVTIDGRDVSVDGTKLDGVEAGADVTDTANVLAAGALMADGSNDTAYVGMTPRASTPGNGKVWVKSSSPTTLMFTRDTGVDVDVGAIGASDVSSSVGSSVDNEVARFDGTTGKIIQSSRLRISDAGRLFVDPLATDSSVELGEIASPAAATTAGTGIYWVRNDAPNRPLFRDDDGRNVQLGQKSVHLYGTLNTNGTVNQWYTWGPNGPSSDAIWDTASGGTGATPTLTTSWTSPGIYFPRRSILTSVSLSYYDSSPSVAHDVEWKLMGHVLSNGMTSVGSAVQHASGGKTTLGLAAARYLTNLTIDFQVVAGDTELYLFTRETTGNASRVDWNCSVNITYYEAE